jgi:hypothetical protein
MTVIVAFRSLAHILVVSDCRVSYIENDLGDDNLQKIYQIGHKFIVGFCGPLSGAYEVMNQIADNLQNYKKELTAGNLHSDVVRWIRFRYQKIQKPEKRKNLSFLLASVEPKREQPARFVSKTGEKLPKPSWASSIPDLKIVSLRPSSSNPQELVLNYEGLCVMGVSNQAKDTIQSTVLHMHHFAPQNLAAQSLAITSSLMDAVEKEGLEKVGGLFQAVILNSEGIRWLTYDMGDVSLSVEVGNFVQVDDLSGKRIPIITIWEWWEHWGKRKKPGDVGAFRDNEQIV